jgi:4-hydroxybenzoate polyprenyltransferase
VLRRLATVLEMIKWQHTIFALPMALASVALATRLAPARGAVWWVERVAIIIGACFAARSAAMAYNRWADRDIDASNPRTAQRASVTGEVSSGFTLLFVGVSCLLFIGFAALLNRLALALSIPVLLVLLGYSHAKRFTRLSHLWLGVCLGLAPVGAWIAILGTLESWTPILLGLSVVVWVAGFDILYALADIEHDQREGLHSIPARLGVPGSLDLAALFHTLAFGLLVVLALTADLGTGFLAGLVAGGVLLALEHRLVRPGELSRLPTAFLTLNGLFSLAILLGVVSDVLLAR